MNTREKMASVVRDVGLMYVTRGGAPFRVNDQVDGGSAELLVDSILDAMREPSEEMVEAGRVPDWDKDGCKGPGEVWRDMIDAIKAGK